MVVKYSRNADSADRDHVNGPYGNGKEKPMTDFQREMLLAEKHAENLRKRQRENLLSRDRPVTTVPETSLDLEEGMILDGNLEGFTEEVHVPKPSDDYDSSQLTLFEDETEDIQYTEASLVNKARVSKLRALHIMEHPHCSKYLMGTIMRVLVTVGSDTDSISSIYPKLVNSHIIFRVERLVKTKEYPVYGYNSGNHCDHQIREFLGNASYAIMGRIMNGQANQALCKINLNDICSSPILQEEIKFGGGEFLNRDLIKAASNLRSFTFTDEDVQLMLMKKLMKESTSPVHFDGSRSQLIVAIQRTCHEIELLTELVKNDPSKLESLRALEERRVKLEEQLQTVKAPTSTPLFVKNCAVLRASDEQNSKGGVMRKTTQPTPMIMFNNSESADSPGNEHRKRERRSIGDLSATEQQQLVKAYMEHMKAWDPASWDPKETDEHMGHPKDRVTGFPGMITWNEYQSGN